jgi:gliding motility-associated-like protein
VATEASGALDEILDCSDAAGIAAALLEFPTFTDNCTATGSITVALVSDIITPDALCANEYRRVRTWTATDACGNISSSYAQIINVKDLVAPVAAEASGVLDRTVECSDAPGLSAALALTPTFTDNCTAAGSVTVTLANDVTTPDLTCTNAYVRVRTWSASDGCGNTSTYIQTITVSDNTAPVITLPASSLTMECFDAAAVTAWTSLATATDNCDPSVSVTANYTAPADNCGRTVTVTFSATDACGNTSTATKDFTVDDNTAPTATNPAPVNVSPISDIPVPDVTVVTDEADNCGNPVVTFVSDVNNGGTGCPGNPYVVTRTYRVSDACGNSTDVTQTLTAIETIIPTLVSSDADNTFCDGTSITFTAGGGTSYDFRVDGVSVQNGASATFTTTTLTDGQVVDVVVTGVSCSATSAAITNSVKSIPSPSFTAEPSGNTCTATTVSYATQSGQLNYAWNIPGVSGTDYAIIGGGSSTDNTLDIKWLTPGNKTITVTYDNAGGCTGSPASSVLIVDNPLAASVNISADASSVCQGSSVTLTATPVNGGTPSYQWYNGANPVGGNSTTYSYVPSNGDVITVVMTSTAVCTSGSPATSNAVTMTVNPILPSSVTISSSASDVCEGSPVTITATPVNGGSSPSYQWLRNGSAVGTDSPVYSYIPSNGDIISVRMISSGNCVSGSPAVSNSITMNVVATPQLSFVKTDIRCNPGSTGAIDITITGGSGPFTYSWTGSGIIPAAEDQTGLAQGNYEVTVSDGMCSTSQAFTINQPDELTIEEIHTDVECPDDNAGTIELTVSGGTLPYSYYWSDGVTARDRTELPAGTYSVAVTDLNACAKIIDVTIGATGSERCVEIPEIITPNDDGFNDTWRIKNIDMFPNAEVVVFNRWGKRVYSSRNILADPWDGTLKGKLLPTDSYHYILDLHNGSKPKSGVISIIK